MRCIIIFFDSLNKRMLSPYGCDWVKTPNFERLAQHSVCFDSCFVGSMPCIPARRDIHTGRVNFLHRSWGPLEPYDISVFHFLKNQGVYSHLISDHMHYWEEGGANYHTKYNSWEIVRGQEGDCWKGHAGKFPDMGGLPGRNDEFRARDILNRTYMVNPEDYPVNQVFRLGQEFLHKNATEDNWLLQIESFDPHEPFHSHEKYKTLYPDSYTGEDFDWPDYKPVDENLDMVQHAKNRYASLVSACDEHMGEILDIMDSKKMWQDTMLLVCTDHGYLLGEHGWWAKSHQPLFNEVANTPFFIWDPSSGKTGEKREQLAQLIDVPPTLLEAFGYEALDTMQGMSLLPCIRKNTQGREGALFGVHGCHVNVTDGRYVYMRAPVGNNTPLYDYTLMPSDMRTAFCAERLRESKISLPFSFTKGIPLLKIPAREWSPIDFKQYGTLLYDIKSDPLQLQALADKKIEEKMKNLMIKLMKENDCPQEQYERLGL